ncbi:hypothetical protein BD779DRAFT_1789973 [Infundibulicybe gibba]|nr:hypothetical protein BD779DRAFT_1789973 [Infundibulicybe gibba]
MWRASPTHIYGGRNRARDGGCGDMDREMDQDQVLDRHGNKDRGKDREHYRHRERERDRGRDRGCHRRGDKDRDRDRWKERDLSNSVQNGGAVTNPNGRDLPLRPTGPTHRRSGQANAGGPGKRRRPTDDDASRQPNDTDDRNRNAERRWTDHVGSDNENCGLSSKKIPDYDPNVNTLLITPKPTGERRNQDGYSPPSGKMLPVTIPSAPRAMSSVKTIRSENDSILGCDLHREQAKRRLKRPRINRNRYPPGRKPLSIDPALETKPAENRTDQCSTPA